MRKTAVLFLLFFSQATFSAMMCYDAKDYYAVYQISTYSCNSGEYLPANTEGCIACPVGFYCPGGVFEFNPSEFQGIDFIASGISTTRIDNICALNFPTDLVAVYEINKYTCSPGQYLPANADGCIICPANNLCVGGTYTFNETLDQGIAPCQNNLLSLPGSYGACYPHILHIENDSVYLKETKTTTPSLNIQIGNNVFFANMTTIQTPMNRDSEHYLKIEYNNNLYYVCDDTTCP